jgi:hypothetical protein
VALSAVLVQEASSAGLQLARWCECWEGFVSTCDVGVME